MHLSYALISRVFSGEAAGLTRDDVLDNVTLTWLTNTALSGARLYWENKLPYLSVKGVSIPVAVSIFPDEICPAPKSWAQRAYPKLIHYNKVDRGGHFAAWEQPKLFSEELRAGSDRCATSQGTAHSETGRRVGHGAPISRRGTPVHELVNEVKRSKCRTHVPSNRRSGLPPPA